jgi:pilus assembly protein CpaD
MSWNDRRFSKEPQLMRAPLFASLALAALCAGVGAARADPAPLTSIENHAIEVKTAPLELMLAAHASGLSMAQTEALRDFSWRWMNGGRSPITVNAPEHGPDSAAVYRTASAARDYLIDQGVPAPAIQIVGYDASGDERAPVKIGFSHYVAEGPQCGLSWSNLSDTRSNTAYPEFGCAVTANFAAQVADSADFLHPRTTDPIDSSRREAEMGLYRSGQTTGTPLDNQANAALSTVGQ